MSWRYRAGLFLIAAVVVIWVTSAEVTQVAYIYIFQKSSTFYMYRFCFSQIRLLRFVNLCEISSMMMHSTCLAFGFDG